MSGQVWIGDARTGVGAVDREDVVFRQRTPMGLARLQAGPALDAGEQAFNPRPVTPDPISVTFELLVRGLLRRAFAKDRNEILRIPTAERCRIPRRRGIAAAPCPSAA